MRILHLLDIPWHSGLADYAVRLAAAERAAGHPAWLAVRPGTAADQAAARLSLPRIPWTRLRDLPRLRRFLQAHQIEVCNAHTGATHTLAALAGAGARGPRPGRPILVRTRADRRTVRRRPFAGWLQRRTAFYVGATDRIRDQLVSALQIPPECGRTIYPAVELPPPPAALDPPPSGQMVTVVGRLDPVKGHGVFLESAARILHARSNARFTVVGREEHLSVALLAERCAELGLTEAVTFAGEVPSVTPYMERATVGVIPSLGSEAVSRVALEWMAHARPVVASEVGGLPEIIEPGRTGLLVPPGQADALAEAVLSLLDDRARLADMGQEARERAETRFSPERLARETLALYAEARCRV